MKVVQCNASLLLYAKKNFEFSHIPNWSKKFNLDGLIPKNVGNSSRQFKGKCKKKVKCSESSTMQCLAVAFRKEEF